MNQNETRKRTSKARRWIRRTLWVVALPVALLLVWIASGIPSKINYVRLSVKMVATQRQYEGQTWKETSPRAGREEVILRTESRNGDYIIKYQPGDYFISIKRGNERLEYCPSWGVASRWTEQQPMEFKHSFPESLLAFWLNPLISARTRKQGQDLVLAMTVRRMWPPEFRCTYTVKTVLDPATFRQKEDVFQSRTSDGQESYIEKKVVEWHKSLPADTFSISLPEDTVMLNERMQSVIQSDEEGGHRMSVFECSQDESEAFLVGFTSQQVGNEDISIDEVAITDANVGGDMGPRLHIGPPLYDRYWSLWRSGTSDRVELLCFRPRSVPGPSVHKLRMEVRAGIFATYESARRVYGRRVTDAHYTFGDVSVSRSAVPVYPECKRPPWSKRWPLAERPRPAPPADQ